MAHANCKYAECGLGLYCLLIILKMPFKIVAFFFCGEGGGGGRSWDKALFLNYFKFSGERVHSQGRHLSGFCFPIWKGVCSERKEFAPGEQILSFESRPLSEGPWCAG